MPKPAKALFTPEQDTPPSSAPFPDHATTVSVRVLPLGAGKVAQGGEGIAVFHEKGAVIRGVPLNVAEAQEANGYVEIQDAPR